MFFRCVHLVLSLGITFFVVSAQAEHIKIGISAPLSGDSAAWGSDIRNAVLLANEHLAENAYTLIFEDERSPKDAVSIAQKFISVDRVQYVLGPSVNATLFAAGPLYERAGVVCISPLGSTGDKKGLGRNIFRIYPADQLSAELLGPYVFERHASIGIVSDQDEYAELIERTLIRLNKDRKTPRKLIPEHSSAGETNYAPLFLKLRGQNIDALILNPINEEGFIRMLKQLDGLGFRVPLYTFILPSSNTVQEALGNKLKGVIYADLPLLDGLLSPRGRDLLREFETRFGAPKSTPLVAALTLEAFRFLDEAIKSGNSVPDYLRNREPVGSLIGAYHFDEDGAVQGVNFRLVEFRDKPQPIALPAAISKR